jgi:outer membrane protein TolC
MIQYLKRMFLLAFIVCIPTLHAQDNGQSEMTYNEFLGYVKKYHPLVKRANLVVSNAQAALMVARGGFDPKIEVDYDTKEFKGTEYYSVLKSSFKIPTWYGIEVKAGFDETDGRYFNPQNRTPDRGLTSVGVSVPLGQGLFINQRMADVREGKLQLQRSDAQRRLRAIEVLYSSSAAYFNWKRSYDEVALYTNYLSFAEVRYKSVITLIEQGDSPAIDSIEAGITVRNRLLNLENAKLKLIKAKLLLSNYLWLEDVPVELQDSIKPESALLNTLDETLRVNEMVIDPNQLDSHPKIQSLQTEISVLDIDRQLNANMLLPKLNVGYYHLSDPGYFRNFPVDDYKFNVNFSLPIFLRKERGYLRLAKLKIQDATYNLGQERLELKNKIVAQQSQVASLKKQKGIIDALVNDYTTMLTSEERLFTYGESSVFLINSRENNLVNARLNQIDIENQFYLSNAELYRILANPD